MRTLLFLFITSLVYSCSVIERTECTSKTVPVTVIYPGGGVINVNVPYCDTIRLKSKRDSVYFKAKAQ